MAKKKLRQSDQTVSPWSCTGSYWKRLLDVNKENAGIDIPIFGAKCYFAFDIEQGNKDFCNKLRVHYFRGAGKTERFLIIAAIPAIIMSIISMAIEWSLKIGAIVGIIYLIKNLPDG